MNGIVWRVARCGLTAWWLHGSVAHYQHEAKPLGPEVFALSFAVLYDIVLIWFPRTKLSIRQHVAFGASLITVALIIKGIASGDYVYQYVPLLLYIPELVIDRNSEKLKRIVFHLSRCAVISLWLFDSITGYHDEPVSQMPAFVLSFAMLYDIALICFPGIRPAVRQNVATRAFPIILAMILFGRAPWGDIIEYLPLCLFLTELVIAEESKQKRLVVVSAALLASFAAVFFSLYRVGTVASYPTATIADRPVSCRMVRILGSKDVIVIAGEDWILTSPLASFSPRESYPNESMVFGSLALIDTRSREGLNEFGYPEILGMDDEGREASWYPKMTYHNKRLSFYIEPSKLFVCNGVHL